MRTLAGLALVVLAAGCGAAKPTEPKLAWSRADLRTGEGGASCGAEPEPAIAGFQPSAPSLRDQSEKGRSTVVPLAAGRSGIATYHVLGHKKELAKLPHVDDTAPFYLEKPRTEQAWGWGESMLIPHVGPHGERLSRAYFKAWESTVRNTPEAFTTESEMMPRVERFVWRDYPTIVMWVAQVPGEDELYKVLAYQGRTWKVDPAAPGVIGGKMLSVSEYAPPLGWLVKWQSGWSFSKEIGRLTADGESTPRWTTVKETKIDLGPALAGMRPDGTCEAVYYDNRSGRVEPASAPTCDEALALLTIDAKRVTDAFTQKSNADQAQAYRNAQEEKKTRAEKEAAAARKAEADKKEADKKVAEQKAVEAPLIKEYVALASAKKYAEACAVATKLTRDTHGLLVTERLEKDHFLHGDEVACLNSRGAGTYSDRFARAVAAAKMTQQVTANAQKTPNAVTGGFQNAPPIKNDGSGQQRLKDINDYTYGSGKGTLCPYTDKSLCK